MWSSNANIFFFKEKTIKTCNTEKYAKDRSNLQNWRDEIESGKMYNILFMAYKILIDGPQSWLRFLTDNVERKLCSATEFTAHKQNTRSVTQEAQVFHCTSKPGKTFLRKPHKELSSASPILFMQHLGKETL